MRTCRSLDLTGTAVNRPCTESARVREGIRKSSHTWRVRVCATVCGVHERIRKNYDDQYGQKRLINFFKFNSTTRPRSTHDTVHSSAFQRETPSARTLVMPRRNPTLPVRTHGQAQRHARPSEKSTGFKVLDSIVSRRSRKSVAIRA